MEDGICSMLEALHYYFYNHVKEGSRQVDLALDDRIYLPVVAIPKK